MLNMYRGELGANGGHCGSRLALILLQAPTRFVQGHLYCHSSFLQFLNTLANQEGNRKKHSDCFSLLSHSNLRQKPMTNTSDESFSRRRTDLFCSRQLLLQLHKDTQNRLCSLFLLYPSIHQQHYQPCLLLLK